MPSAIRNTAIALLSLFAISGAGIAPAAAQQAGQEQVDTTRLPRIAGSKTIYANASHTIFTSPESVAGTIEVTRKLLASGGWQEYVLPFSASADNPAAQQLTFKKGMQGLSAFIAVAPAQANATSVSYTALVYAIDLPFPKEATDIAYSPDRPHLDAVAGGTIEDTLEFFRKELTARGWALWSMKERAKQTAGNAESKSDKGAYAYYVRDDRDPLFLTIQRRDDDRLKVQLQRIPPSVLTAQSKPAEPPAPVARVERPKPPTDDLAAEIEKQVRAEVSRALAGTRQFAPAPAPVQAQPAPAEAPLQALAGSNAPIPLPATADGVEIEAGRGEIEFTSASSVAALAAFHRAAMKPLGWQERPTPINRPNMVVLDFTKGGKKITFTIMQMGRTANVRANGSGLVSEAAARETPAAGERAKATPEDTKIEEIAAGEEKSGMPMPERTTQNGTERTPFRVVLTAKVPANLASVLAFYRRELGKRNWKEEKDGAVVTADKVVLAYTSPDGPAVLKLGRDDGETSVSLALRKTAEATKAGLLPKAGQTKMMFGNMMPSEATITVNRQTIKVAAGAGAKKPDGPSLDLPPGKYKVSFKVGGGPAQSEDVEVGANETWGVLIGPGGALPLQVY